MKILLVPWALLLFGASLSSAHYIRQAEDGKASVDEVPEDSAGVSFVNQKPEKRTLREIVYYHMIERDRDELGSTERSFTNTHGYQFLEHPSSDEPEYGEHEEYEEPDDYLRYKTDENDENENEQPDNEEFAGADQDTENYEEAEPETLTKPKPLTNDEVKEAYKARSYLFDQLRQRYAVKRMADSLHRKKREAELGPIPEAPMLSSDIANKVISGPPNTFGMNLNQGAGSVWNNLNKPTSYELGPSNGNPSEGQDESPQSQDNLPSSEIDQQSDTGNGNPEPYTNPPDPTAENNDDELSDICVDINKPCALRLGTAQEPNENSELIHENSDNDSAASSAEPSVGEEPNDNTEFKGAYNPLASEESNEGAANPIGAEPVGNPESSYPVEPSAENAESSGNDANNRTYGMSLTSDGGHVWNHLVDPPVSYEVGSSNGNQDFRNSNPESNISEGNYQVEPIIGGSESNDNMESNEGPNYPTSYDVPENVQPNEPIVENSGPIRSENDQESDIAQPEKPISEDNVKPAGESYENSGYSYEESQLPQIPENSPEGSSEEGKIQASYATDNPYFNPQMNPEDKKAMEDNMESIFATMQPVEDITQTYGMNLTSDGGQVWNTLANENENAGPINENPATSENPQSNDSEANVFGGNESNEGAYPNGPGISENPIPSYPIEPAGENAEASDGSQPDTPHEYGMDLNSDGGHVTNTMVNPPVSSEIGSSTENPEPNNGESNDSGSNEEPASMAPPIYENPEPNNSESNDSGLHEEPVSIVPPIYENQEPSYPVEPVIDNSGHESDAYKPDGYGTPEVNPISEGPKEPAAGSYEYPGSYETSQPELEPESTTTGSGEGGNVWKIPEAPTLPPLNYDNLPAYIRDVISSTEKPEYQQTTNPYSNPQTSSEDKLEGIFATVSPVTDVPKTYGMNLSSDAGHVWNDLVNPPVAYDVGSPSKSQEEHKEEPTSAPEIIEQPPYESEEAKYPIPEPATPEQEAEEPIAQPDQEPEPNHEPEPQTPEDTNYTPIEPAQPIPIEPQPAEESETAESNSQAEDGKQKIEDTEQPQEQEQPAPIEQKPDENVKPDIMAELLKSEQFWKWLGEWTATYMELLEKHIRKIAIQEICNSQRARNQICPIDGNPEDTEGVIKDGKIVVDGKEMELTHTDNLDTEDRDNDENLKRGNHNHDNGNKGNNNGHKIEASAIYGNSVGNERVTNVFIFTADKADEVIDKLKPSNDSEIDFIIDERIKEEENKESNESPNEETVGKSGGNGESNESSVDKEELNKEEINKKESTEGETESEELNKEEADKKESSEGDANAEELENKESNEEEVNKEKVNKEVSNESEPNKEEDENNKEEFGGSEINKQDLSKETNEEESKERKDNNEEFNKYQADKGESSEGDMNEEELNKKESEKPELNGSETNEEELNKKPNEELESEGNNDELNKEEANEESKESEAHEEEFSKEESSEAEVTDEELNKDEANKDESNDGEAIEEELNKEEAENEEKANGEELNKGEEPKEGKKSQEELNKDVSNKDESKVGEPNKEELNKGEASKEESNESEVNEKESEVIETNNGAKANEGKVNEEKLNEGETNEEESDEGAANEEKSDDEANNKELSEEEANNEEILDEELNKDSKGKKQSQNEDEDAKEI